MPNWSSMPSPSPKYQPIFHWPSPDPKSLNDRQKETFTNIDQRRVSRISVLFGSPIRLRGRDPYSADHPGTALCRYDQNDSPLTSPYFPTSLVRISSRYRS